jgi:hypothetical protein
LDHRSGLLGLSIMLRPRFGGDSQARTLQLV